MNIFEKKLLYIDLNREISVKNFDKYYLTIARYYNEGNYEEALKGFRKLVEFSNKLRFYLIPYIEKCSNVLLKAPQKKKFTLKKNRIRCKYCGYYTEIETENKKYHPHHFIPYHAFFVLCRHCGKDQPEPSIIWDSWDGLENADNLNASLNELIRSYSEEYKEWLDFRNISDEYKHFFSVDKKNWIEYQIKILRSIIANYWNEKGLSLFNQGHYDDALNAFENAIKFNSNFAESLQNLSSVLDHLGRHKEALKTKTCAAKVWFDKGFSLNKLFSFPSEKALYAFEKAVKIKPDYFEAWKNIGRTLDALGRKQEALKAFDKAIDLAPDDENAWSIKGHILSEFGRHKEALAAYNKAIEIKPSYYGFLGRGDELFALERYDEASEAYNRAIEIEPDLAFAWFGRARLFSLLGNKKNMLRDLSRAISLHDAESFRKEAKQDVCFRNFWDDEDFKKIVS